VAVTIKELSKACGLSVSTVSKALNGYPDISEETRNQVRQTAQELGYHPNALARGLKMGRTFNLGVLFVDENNSGLTHHYFSAVLDSFKVEAERQGYDITFINHNIGREPMTYLEHCRYRNVDGVCLACVNFNSPEVLELVASEIPVVTIDHVFNDRMAVISENQQGMADLVRYVHSMGHRKIAYVYGEKATVTTRRLTSFLHTMEELKLPVPENYLVPALYHNPRAVKTATEQLLKLADPPTCILLPDDYAALGAFEAAGTAGLRIPEDLSVAGYDGIQLMQLFSPKLTTIRQDTKQIGSQAAQKLIQLVEKPRSTLQEATIIPSSLLEGGSVAPPAHG